MQIEKSLLGIPKSGFFHPLIEKTLKIKERELADFIDVLKGLINLLLVSPHYRPEGQIDSRFRNQLSWR